MCRRVTCKHCTKPTYAGCGRHVEAVLADVPVEARCRCRELNAGKTPPAGQSRGWLASVLSRFSGGRS